MLEHIVSAIEVMIKNPNHPSIKVIEYLKSNHNNKFI
jgi:hypothetical protein